MFIYFHISLSVTRSGTGQTAAVRALGLNLRSYRMLFFLLCNINGDVVLVSI